MLDRSPTTDPKPLHGRSCLTNRRYQAALPPQFTFRPVALVHRHPFDSVRTVEHVSVSPDSSSFEQGKSSPARVMFLSVRHWCSAIIASTAS